MRWRGNQAFGQAFPPPRSCFYYSAGSDFIDHRLALFADAVLDNGESCEEFCAKNAIVVAQTQHDLQFSRENS